MPECTFCKDARQLPIMKPLDSFLELDSFRQACVIVDEAIGLFDKYAPEKTAVTFEEIDKLAADIDTTESMSPS